MGYYPWGWESYPKSHTSMEDLLLTMCAPRMDIMVNCERLERGKDPSKHAPVRCTGEHIKNLEACLFMNGTKLKDDFKMIRIRVSNLLEVRAMHATPDPIHIGFMCRAGRRSSIATCRLTIEALKMNGYKVDDAYYLSENTWADDNCTTCEDCDAQSDAKVYLYGIAQQMWSVAY